MRLSDAIMLGSTLIGRLDPSKWLENNCGCLIGIGLKTLNSEKTEANSEDVLIAWPWLGQVVDRPLLPGPDPLIKQTAAINVISEMAWKIFNKDYTLEQAVDWIRSVEPDEPPVTEDKPDPIWAAIEATFATMKK